MESSASLTSQFLAMVGLVSQIYEVTLEKTGISRLRWGILYLVQVEAPQTMSSLTRRLDIAKSNVTYHVDWLEENGYLERETSAEDRRVTHLRLTPKGGEVMRIVPDEIGRRMAHLAAQVSPAELILMESGLKLLLAHSALLLGERPAEGGGAAAPGMEIQN